MTAMNRTTAWSGVVLAVLAVVAGSSASVAVAAGTSRAPNIVLIVAGTSRAPNIVLIVADDLGWGDVGFNGRTEWSTPSLDALAKQGRVLKRCYTAAVVCAPSRAAFMTGKSTILWGVRKNKEALPPE